MERAQEEHERAIETILATMRRVAVVGISADPARASNEVASYLIRQGFIVHGVNPLLKTVFGAPCYACLSDVPGPLEVVDIFRRSELAGVVVDEAIAVSAKAVWMQEGVIDEAAAERARSAGLLVVMDRCMLKEHAARLARDGRFA
jgi:predicted CoA-binding protein